MNGRNYIRLLFLSAKLFKFEIQKCGQILCAHKPYFLMPGHILWCHHSTVFVCKTRMHIHTQRKHLINISALLMDDCFILQYSPALLAPVQVRSFVFICVCSCVHLIMLMITTG